MYSYLGKPKHDCTWKGVENVFFVPANFPFNPVLHRSTWCQSTFGVRTSWCGASTWRTCRLTRRVLSPNFTSCPGWTAGSPAQLGLCWISAGIVKDFAGSVQISSLTSSFYPELVLNHPPLYSVFYQRLCGPSPFCLYAFWCPKERVF